MKLRKLSKLAVTVSLVAGMVSAGGVQSLAAEGVYIDAVGPEESVTETYEDITDGECGLAADVLEGAAVTVTTGTITVDDTNDWNAVGVTGDIGTDSSLNITTGDIVVSSTTGSALGASFEDGWDSDYEGSELGDLTLSTGSITATGEEAAGIEIYSNDCYFNADITVNGDVTASADLYAEGIEIYTDEPEYYGYGYDDDPAAGDSQISVLVNGDVNASISVPETVSSDSVYYRESLRVIGVDAEADTSQIDVTVQGVVNVLAESQASPVMINAGGVIASAYGPEGTSSAVTVRDGVSTTGPGAVYGAVATAGEAGDSASVTVEGGGVSTDNSGVDIDALRQAMIEMIEERASDYPEEYRDEYLDRMMEEIDAYLCMYTMNIATAAITMPGATAEVTVTGDVAAVGGASENDGIFLETYGPMASESFNTTGVLAGYDMSRAYYYSDYDSEEAPSGGSASVTVNGNVTSDGDGVVAWISMRGYSPMVRGELIRAMEESLQNEAAAVDGAQASEEPVVLVTVDGDVTAVARGLVFSLIQDLSPMIIDKEDAETEETGEEEALPRADIVISGTLSGDRGGIVFTEGSGEYLDLTVWKVVLDEDGHAAVELFRSADDEYYYDYPVYELAEDDSSEEPEYTYEYTDAARELEQRIMYIIKLEQPEEGGSLAATKADGSALETSHDYEVAHEGDKVILAVNVEDGYHLVEAYNGTDKAEILGQDADGNYYIEVPCGGGVYLSVLIEKDEEPVPEPDPEPEPEPEPEPQPVPDEPAPPTQLATRVPTGDGVTAGKWIGLMLTSAVCLGGVAVFWKKRSEMEA